MRKTIKNPSEGFRISECQRFMCFSFCPWPVAAGAEITGGRSPPECCTGGLVRHRVIHGCCAWSVDGHHRGCRRRHDYVDRGHPGNGPIDN